VDFPHRRSAGAPAQRIGQALPSELKGVRRRSAASSHLQVVEANSAVVRFYEKAGYEIESRVSMSKRPPSKV